MKKRHKEVNCGDFTANRISVRPDSLIDCILDLLSDEIGTVVRTSVLSKRWKSCWTRVKKLNFYMDVIEAYTKQTELDVGSIVDSVLSKHDGPVEIFVCPLLSYQRVGNMIFPSGLSSWQKKGIFEFYINGARSCYMGIPSCILNCATLRHLNLEKCQLGPLGDFCGFINLVYLCLWSVKNICGPLLEAWISNSPRLEDLRLKHLQRQLSIQKGLLVSKDDYDIVINAPRLPTLCLNMRGNFSLKEFSKLTYVSVNLEFVEPMIGHQRASKLENFV